MLHVKRKVCLQIFIFAVIILCVSIVAYFYFERLPASAVPNVDSAQSSEDGVQPRNSTETVEQYYKNRIDFLNGKSDVDPTVSEAFVTAKIIRGVELFEVWTSGLEDPIPMPEGYAFQNADPIFCAQDFPDDLVDGVVEDVYNDGSEAVVRIALLSYWPPITVSLIYRDGWRINEIACEDGSIL